jgi:hypothetical protein
MRQGSVPPRWPTEASSSVNRSGDGDRMRHFALALDAVENAEHRAAAAPSSTPWQSPAISCSASRARPVRVGVSRPLPARRAARSHAAAMAFDLFDLRAPSVDGGLRPHDIDRSPCMGLAIMFAICSKRGGAKSQARFRRARRRLNRCGRPAVCGAGRCRRGSAAPKAVDSVQISARTAS